MHGHIHGVGVQSFQGPSAAALAKTSAAQQAAATRRKLLRAAAEMGEVSSDAVELLGQWGGGQRERRDSQAHSGNHGKHDDGTPASQNAAESVLYEPITSGRAISFYV